MQLVVSGTRDGRNDVYYWLSRWAQRYGLPTRMIVGCARGVDAAAQSWARLHTVPLRVCVANWAMGKRAGHLRNQEMVDAALPGDWLLAFPSVDSRGTYDCVRRARKADLNVTICPPARPSCSAMLKPRMSTGALRLWWHRVEWQRALCDLGNNKRAKVTP